jgi:hypothetical protein
MDPGTASEIIRLRESGYLPRSDRELQSLVPSMGPILEMIGRDFTRRTTYTTDQVEILAQGWVDGGVVQVTSRVVVQRGNTEADVVWREVF